MAYERVHKSFGQSSSKKKHSPIVPPLIEQQTPADSQLSPLVKLSSIPSKEEREAIKRKIFETLDRTGENQAMRSGLYNPTVPEQKTPDASTIGMPIQAKLTIGEPGDKYEQEADKVADIVVNLINAPVTQQKSQNLQREEISSLNELQMKSVADTIQHSKMLDEEKLQMQTIVQLQPDVGGMTATPEVETSIQQARSGGQPLADNVRQPMEQAFGADFSRVKVHTDTQADQLNQSIQARAFTTGQDVFFRSGEYNPGSRGGQELLAHELTHVVQQNSGAVQKVQKVNGVETTDMMASVMAKNETEPGWSLYKKLIRKYSLQINHTNENVVYLSTVANQEHGKAAAVAQYWYRAMSLKEFNALRKGNYLPPLNDFGGVATNRNYSNGYITNNSVACVCVEFHIPDEGQLFKLLREAGINDPKPEGDGGTYGLGATGQKPGKTGITALSIFNELFDPNYRVVNLKIPRP